MKTKKPTKKSLERFYREVAMLTSQHDVLGDSAVVYPSKLGKALAKVDPNWWKMRFQPLKNEG